MRYPVYIISKDRADSRYTSRTLEYMNVPYYIVVEPHQYVQYARVINSKKILVTPFKNLGQGSIPARNFVFEHAVESGAKRHWILDDNIMWFYRLHNNMKVPVTYDVCFSAIEDFVDRYENIGLAGMQYDYFARRKYKLNPFSVNVRIYSCILVNHAINMRWRGKYNEDTDLSIRVLKDGWCTVLFNAFLCGKIPTMTMRGGNTTSIYNETNNRKEFAEALQKLHPDIVQVVKRFNRWHHKVDYSAFKNNELKFKKGVKLPSKPNEYGMELIHFKEPKTIFTDKL